ncbi:crotonobetainyl-CoA:carnitine CoA-transferase CaiB-like acyl-CoA transferase [Mycolicibacterium sp. BK634]|uniref:CaiB/BaiF CoA transferase family protein n=1 Tax=Mycolicibacterium sp. BK634 TaxID=2587099 RepID=UPI001617A3DC|nr:CoA transferase [Mycolicibacterium sp. BK634]MBB3748705.1 crotonobetainyl-CoA:carnitine CoA-transferase CaiB-like acyl-CoA transferase [Mycolicibacterium sp. BK634]
MAALNGFRIVELAEGVAGEYCGKLLADLGADVVKVERPGRGSPTRAMAPLLDIASDPERSGLFAYLNTNKRSVALDAHSPAVQDLIASADAVIDDHHPVEPPNRRGLVFCSITPFGASAPPELQNSKSINIFQAGGWGHHTPSHPDPALPPLKGPGRYSPDYEAGLDAALCVMAALFRQMHTGDGEFIDISQHAVMVARADCILGRFITGEVSPENTRDDFDQQGPASMFACADGFVYLYMTSRGHWLALEELLDHADWLDAFDDDWLEFSVTPEKVAAFKEHFAAWISDRPRGATAEAAQRLGVALVPVNGADDLLCSPQYRHRRFFTDVTHPVLGTAAYPGAPYSLTTSPAEIRTPAPTLGQHTEEVVGSLSAPRDRPTVRAPQLKKPARRRGGPLEGVRVVELTKVWAGPYTGKLLALLGAEVIKVECSALPEEMRAYGGTDINHAPYFLSINPEILSVDLDIKTTQGMAALRDLVADSDIVLNNLRPGAMERQGLGYADLAAVKPDLISVSIKMWGNDGPLGYQTGYAPSFSSLAGLAALVGYEGGPPLGANMRYGDSTVGAAAAVGAIAALLHRERTGQGQFVDISAVEVLSSMVGDRLAEYTMTGGQLLPDGNRHPDFAPHGCYPCGDQWISIAIGADDEWRCLCAELGAPDLLADTRYATAADRQANIDSLDAAITALTAPHDAAALARRLRAVGVPATKSASAVEVIEDALLWERGTFRFVSDHREGQRPILGASWLLSRAPVTVERGAPDLGEDNEYVLGKLLHAGHRSATP